MDTTGIKKAIEYFGSQSALAEAIGVSRQFVCQLANGHRPIPAALAPTIEQATDSAVRCKDLRPDIFRDPVAA